MSTSRFGFDSDEVSAGTTLNLTDAQLQQLATFAQLEPRLVGHNVEDQNNNLNNSAVPVFTDREGRTLKRSRISDLQAVGGGITLFPNNFQRRISFTETTRSGIGNVLVLDEKGEVLTSTASLPVPPVRGVWPCLVEVGNDASRKHQTYINFEYVIRDGIATVFMPETIIEMGFSADSDTAQYIGSTIYPFDSSKTYTPMPPAIYPASTRPNQSVLLWQQGFSEFTVLNDPAPKYMYDTSRSICLMNFIRPSVNTFYDPLAIHGTLVIHHVDSQAFKEMPRPLDILPSQLTSFRSFFLFSACTFQIWLQDSLG